MKYLDTLTETRRPRHRPAQQPARLAERARRYPGRRLHHAPAARGTGKLRPGSARRRHPRDRRPGILRLLALLRHRRLPVRLLRAAPPRVARRVPRCRPSPGSAPATTRPTAKNYVISYNDCCGRTPCGQCLCTRNEGDRPMYRPDKNNDLNWCLGTQSAVYHCSTAIIIGLGLE